MTSRIAQTKVTKTEDKLWSLATLRSRDLIWACLIMSTLFNLFTFWSCWSLQRRLFLSEHVQMIIQLDKNTVLMTREAASLNGLNPDSWQK